MQINVNQDENSNETQVIKIVKKKTMEKQMLKSLEGLSL